MGATLTWGELWSVTVSAPDMSNVSDPKQNRLLAALPPSDLARLLPELKPVSFPLGGVIYESGDQLRGIYFLTAGIVSLLYVMKNGSSAEIAVVGNEGLVGVALFMGGQTTPSRAIVQSTAHAFELKAEAMMKEFDAAVHCSTSCCVTPRHCLPRWHKPRCVIASIPWSSNYAAGCS